MIGRTNKKPIQQVFEAGSLIFTRPGEFRRRQCLQFRGGTYTGQKIDEERLPLEVRGLLQ
jgi:hypothetical protein